MVPAHNISDLDLENPFDLEAQRVLTGEDASFSQVGYGTSCGIRVRIRKTW